MRLLGICALALVCAQLAAGQTCGNIDVKSAGARGNGNSNDITAFQKMEGDNTVGLIYMGPGDYLVQGNLKLTKPIMADGNAAFVVPSGSTLTLQSQPEHPLTTFFKGGGQVFLAEGTVRCFPEWFGARGNGQADDQPALARALAAASSGNPMLYLRGQYGLGRELVIKNKVTIMAEPSAKIVSVNGNGNGLTFVSGGFAYKNVLPHLSGFTNFCLRLQGSDLGALQLQTLSGCGDAIRFEANVDGSANNDGGTVLDNTIWFDQISNSNVAVAFRAGKGCIREKCVYQGNQVVGNLVQGCRSGASAVVGFFSSVSNTRSDRPAWDSNQFDIGTVTPCTNNPSYAVFSAAPNVESNREVLKIGMLNTLGQGQLFSGWHNMMQANIRLGDELPNNSAELQGALNLVEFSGRTTPPSGTSVRAVTGTNQCGSFNGGKRLTANYFTLDIVPTSDWPAGGIQQFFFCHQLATGMLYQIKCDAAKLASTKLPVIGCAQVADNSQGGANVGTQVQNEVALNLINMSPSTIGKGQKVQLQVAVATLGNP